MFEIPLHLHCFTVFFLNVLSVSSRQIFSITMLPSLLVATQPEKETGVGCGPLPVTVVNEGLQGSHIKRVIILVVTGILGGGKKTKTCGCLPRLVFGIGDNQC